MKERDQKTDPVLEQILAKIKPYGRTTAGEELFRLFNKAQKERFSFVSDNAVFGPFIADKLLHVYVVTPQKSSTFERVIVSLISEDRTVIFHWRAKGVSPKHPAIPSEEDLLMSRSRKQLHHVDQVLVGGFLTLGELSHLKKIGWISLKTEETGSVLGPVRHYYLNKGACSPSEGTWKKLATKLKECGFIHICAGGQNHWQGTWLTEKRRWQLVSLDLLKSEQSCDAPF